MKVSNHGYEISRPWPWDLTPNTQTATPTVMLSYNNLQKKNSYKYFSGVELGFPCCSGVGLLCWIVLSSASMACSSSEKGSWFSSWSRWLPAVDVGFIAKEEKWQIQIDELPKLNRVAATMIRLHFALHFLVFWNVFIRCRFLAVGRCEGYSERRWYVRMEPYYRLRQRQQ